MHHTKGIGQNVLEWRSFIVVLCLRNLASGYYKRRSLVWVIQFHLWGKQYTFLRWRRIKTDWPRGLWRDGSACVDGGIASIKHTEREHSYLLPSLGLSVGTRQIVWEMAFGYRAHHQQSINILWKMEMEFFSLKRTNRGGGGDAYCLDPTSPPRLMSNEQNLWRCFRNSVEKELWWIILATKFGILD